MRNSYTRINAACVECWCGVTDARHVNTTLCALSSVARLSVSMTMLMSSGIYRSPSYQDRCRALALRRPASMTAPGRSGGARALKRRTVSGGEVLRTPSRIESMPNMRYILDVTRRLARRRERAHLAGARTKCAAVDALRKTGAKTEAVRYSATKVPDSGDDHATTSGSSSVVVDIEATPTPISSVVDRTSLPPPLPRPESLIRPETDDFRCVQSPVNSSGVRIVIDSDDDDDDNDGVPPWSLTDLQDDAANQSHLPDGSETAANSGSVSSLTSGSGDGDSSSAIVLFQCGPSDDLDDVGVVESTSGYRSTMISSVAGPPTRGAKSNMGTGSDASSFHLLSDNHV